MTESRPTRWIAVEALALRAPLTGVGRYTSKLLAALLKRHPDVGLDLCVLGSAPLDLSLLEQFGPERIVEHRRWRLTPRAYRALLAARVAPSVERVFPVVERSCAILYPNFIRYPTGRDVPEVVIVYDATFKEFPDDKSLWFRVGWTRLTSLALRSPARAVTISHAAAADIERWFKASSGLTVLYPGADPLPVDPSRDRVSEAGYVLVIGTASPRKNVGTVLRAHQSLPVASRPRLVVVGRGHLPSDGVEVRGFVSDVELAGLVADADLLVAPSLNEGFDLPVVEALSVHTPVAASDIPVHREVLGEAAAGWFDPNDHEHLATLLRRPAVPGGPADLSRFNWGTSAGQLSELLRL